MAGAEREPAGRRAPGTVAQLEEGGARSWPRSPGGHSHLAEPGVTLQLVQVCHIRCLAVAP